jgi:hypothetical protein
VERRQFLGGAAAIAVAQSVANLSTESLSVERPFRRVRPGDSRWPSDAEWNGLREQVGGRLIRVTSPLSLCQAKADAEPCNALFESLKNPYYIGDDVALTQTCGWLDAWSSAPSVYAVAARNAADVSAAIKFARRKDLRLVVKGGGHSYLGTSNAPDSLLVWTRPMRDIVVHDSFLAKGCEANAPPQRAVSVGAGAIWLYVYNEVTKNHGRYVQGGGCATVGVAGLVLGGGFGSYSKRYGVAAASLLEAEIVTADGAVRIANPYSNPDLFWALKGGGGGTFGVVTRMTLQTHELPEWFGFVMVAIRSSSRDAFRKLLRQFVSFYAEHLHNPHWGEIANVRPGNILNIQMSFQGLDEAQAKDLWRPFLDWVSSQPESMLEVAPMIRAIPATKRWDTEFIKEIAPWAIRFDNRVGADPNDAYWTANVGEAGHYIYAYQSVWLSEALLVTHRRNLLVDALISASDHSGIELHFQKGLAGGAAEARRSVRQTSMNPAVRDAFVLAIVGSEAPPAFSGVAGHEPDVIEGRRQAGNVSAAMAALWRVSSGPACYVAESDYFLSDWRSAYWGTNYAKLLKVKRKYDPGGLFFAHHCVGSEDWSADGFTRLRSAT